MICDHRLLFILLQLHESEKILGKKGRYLDFLDVLLTAKDDSGQGLTDQEIRDEVDTFLFEGNKVACTCPLIHKVHRCIIC